MSIGFDTPEYPPSHDPMATDTLVDSVIILLALTVVQRLVGFVRAVLFCRWLDPEQLGLWDMAFSFLVLASPICVLGIPGVFGRYLERYRHRGQLGAFLRATVVACAMLGVMAVGGVLFARQELARLVFGSGNQAQTMALTALCLLMVIVYNFQVEWFTAMRRIRTVSVMQLVNSATFAVLGIVLLWTWRCSADSVLVAYAGSCLVAATWAGRRLPAIWRDEKGSPRRGVARERDFWTQVAPFAAWVLLGSVLMNLFGMVDRYMILHFVRASSAQALDMVGNYHSSRVVPLLLVSIAGMLATVSMPHLSHDWEAGRRPLVAARLRLFLKIFGFALFCVSVIVLWASPLLFSVAFHGKFPSGEAILPWTLLYCSWFSISLVMQNYMLCAERAGFASAALACGIALNLALNVVLLPKLGLEGAALSTTAANALSLALVCALNRRLGFHLDFGTAVVLVLPVLLCVDRWAAAAAIPLVMLGAMWRSTLLGADEKRQLSEGMAEYVERLRQLDVRRMLSAWRGTD